MSLMSLSQTQKKRKQGSHATSFSALKCMHPLTTLHNHITQQASVSTFLVQSLPHLSFSFFKCASVASKIFLVQLCSSPDRLMEGSNSTGAPARYQFPASNEPGDHVECSGRSCRSCIAVLVADCIALGCCPCAVVNMLALTLVKVPWMVSRRCLESLKRRGAPWRRRVAHVGDVDKTLDAVMAGREGKCLEMKRNKRNEEGVEGENGHGTLPSSLDNRVWMELYHVGNWGFGRVSFSAIQREWRSGKNAGGGAQSGPATSGDEEIGKQL